VKGVGPGYKPLQYGPLLPHRRVEILKMGRLSDREQSFEASARAGGSRPVRWSFQKKGFFAFAAMRALSKHAIPSNDKRTDANRKAKGYERS